MNTLRSKKLLIIAPNYANFIKDQIDLLAREFCEISVIVRYNPLSEISRFLPIAKLQIKRIDNLVDLEKTPENVHIFPVPVFNIPVGNSQEVKKGEQTYNSIKKIIKKEKIEFDYIHAHFVWPEGYAGVRLKEEYHKPLVITAHGFDIYELPFQNGFWKDKISTVLNAADSIITVSEHNKRYIDKLNVSVPVTVIHNGFREDLFFPQNRLECRKTLQLPAEKKIIISVGYLEPVKGHTYLIDAIKEIAQTDENILCIIIGNGVLRKTLQDQINKNHLQNFIRLTGHKRHDEIAAWINASDILVLPSIQESFGVVQIEAFACGKPVVATRNGGSDELIQSDKIGILATNQDAHALSEALKSAFGKSWDSKDLIEYAAKFNWISISREIGKVYGAIHPEK